MATQHEVTSLGGKVWLEEDLPLLLVRWGPWLKHTPGSQSGKVCFCHFRPRLDLFYQSKASHLATVCTWDSSPHLAVTPVKLMRYWQKHVIHVLYTQWVTLRNIYACFLLFFIIHGDRPVWFRHAILHSHFEPSFYYFLWQKKNPQLPVCV